MARGCAEQRILHVDLTEGRSWKEAVEPERLRALLGGRGIAAALLREGLSEGVDPLGPENVLILSSGTLTGTNAPTAGRMTATTKSPQTGAYLKTSAGGHFGAALRMSGYGFVMLHGASERPVYLWIDGETVELRDARDLWGKGVRETTRALSDGARGVEVACIGPAGENLVRFANIMCSFYCAAARGGAGAVMGSKKLKAIAANGRAGGLSVARPGPFEEVAAEVREAIYGDTLARQLYEFGTAADVDFFNELHLTPSYNFRRSFIDDPEGVKRLSGRSWLKEGYLKGRRGCSGCILGCHRYTEIDEGRFAGTYCGGPQLDPVNSVGPRCGNTDVELVFKINQTCNDMGLDLTTTGTAIAWLMETYEKGLIADSDLEEIEPRWGDEDAMLQLVDRIVRREGIGELLSGGTKAAAEKVGGGSSDWAVHVKGLEITAVELRAAYSYALAFAVASRGGDHLSSETLAEFGGTPEARAVMRKITGSEEYIGGTVLEKRAEIVKWHEDIYAVTDALGLCAFSTTATYGVDEERAARLFSHATGIDFTADEIMRAGSRIVTLERAFNMREGFSRKDDTAPPRMLRERQDDLTSVEDPILPQEKLDIMLDEYYRLRGWDIESGRPTSGALREAGLEELAGRF